MNNEKKEQLSRTISKIEDAQHLKNILDIIIDNNKDINITENENGIYLFFHNLKTPTYKLLIEYIKNNKCLTSPKINKKYFEYDNNKYYESKKKLKFTNMEMEIIKKCQYIEDLNKFNSLFN